ncbi:MAG: FkbM family methyltransferase [Pseudomonadota bacterium]
MDSSDPFRNLRLYWHRFRKTKSIELEGVRLVTDASMPKLIRSLIFKRTYEQAERVLLRDIVQPGDCVLEIGAGIGFIGLLSARLAGPSGRVVSYEANPALRPLIEANYAKNSLRPELRMRAVSIDGRPIELHVNESILSSSFFSREATQSIQRIKSDAFQTILRELNPDVLVMDVEGAETDLLAACDLGTMRSALVELHPHIVGDDKITALLEGLSDQGFGPTKTLDKNITLRRV